MSDLCSAVQKADIEAVQALLKSGSDANGADSRGETALHLAAKLGGLAFVKILLDAGANPNVQSQSRGEVGQTALHFAAFEGNIGTVKALLAAGADPNTRAKDDGEGAALHVAAYRGERADVIKLLIGAGADKNAALIGPELTALHFACKRGDQDSVKVLLELGADIDPKDMEGKTPLHHATQPWQEDVALVPLSCSLPLGRTRTQKTRTERLLCATQPPILPSGRLSSTQGRTRTRRTQT